jgi:hypothetical protein
MSNPANPSLKEFVALLGDELVLAQVLIRRSGKTFELCHAGDADEPREFLRLLTLADLRLLSQRTTSGEFRPLKSAPTLQRGWLFHAAGDRELDDALGRLYPGAVADWFAAQSPKPPVTHYREFTVRQSGMYRITTFLADAEVAEVIAHTCARELCLKRRMWTVPGLPADGPEAKSLIPCLEPCALLLEAARTAVRLAQHRKSGSNPACLEGEVD